MGHKGGDVNTQSLILSPATRALFDKAGTMGKVAAVLSTNLDYALYQEIGTKRMAAHPMVGPYLAEYQAIVEDCLKEAFALHPGDPMQAVTVGIEHAALIILGNIANRAAVDTGRLKNSWTATLPDGRRTTFGPIVTAEQQRAMRKARALASAKRAAGGRTAAKRA
jgi:hypothetical protein